MIPLIKLISYEVSFGFLVIAYLPKTTFEAYSIDESTAKVIPSL